MRVLQLIDSLDPGGAERVAVQLANALVPSITKSFLCATRKEGLLKASLHPEVGYLFLNKKRTVDIRAILTLKNYIKQHDITIVHAHSSSFFIAVCVKILVPKLKIVWHDHYGDSDYLHDRKALVLKLCSYFFSAILSVNPKLEEWANRNLYCNNVMYLRNYAKLSTSKRVTVLKGQDHKRVLCLANLRPQKDHLTLFKAFQLVVQQHPHWTLHCVGKDFNDAYSKTLRASIKDLELEQFVFLYDSKNDISSIIEQCDIGVLSSLSEGLPLSLLEYGLGRLAVVASDVGYCKDVIENEINGYLIEKQNPKSLAKHLLYYIDNETLRQDYADALYKKVTTSFSEEAVIDILVSTYTTLK